MATATTAKEYAERPEKGELLSPALLRALVNYDPETGEFTWNPRPAALFNNEKRDAVYTAQAWNTRRAGKRAFATVNVHGYCVAGFFGKFVYAHRAAWAFQTGEWPDEQIDHLDGDRSNNVWSNLRQVTNAINARNTKLKSTNTTGVVGVCWFARTNRWHARICINGRHHHLGYFRHRDDAIAARNAAEIGNGFTNRHGEKA